MPFGSRRGVISLHGLAHLPTCPPAAARRAFRQSVASQRPKGEVDRGVVMSGCVMLHCRFPLSSVKQESLMWEAARVQQLVRGQSRPWPHGTVEVGDRRREHLPCCPTARFILEHHISEGSDVSCLLHQVKLDACSGTTKSLLYNKGIININIDTTAIIFPTALDITAHIHISINIRGIFYKEEAPVLHNGFPRSVFPQAHFEYHHCGRNNSRTWWQRQPRTSRHLHLLIHKRGFHRAKSPQEPPCLL